jgi:pimeloyl-ACP methyl ester carboxylesterase
MVRVCESPLMSGVIAVPGRRDADVDIVLIAGLWLEESAWAGVAARLGECGHRPVPVALPGQGDGSTSATLADQVAAVLAAVDSAEGRPMVVGHSAASSLAWLAVDARPDKVAKAVFIGGWPAPDGTPYFDGLPVKDGAVPFPGWDEFEGPDSADLDDAARRAFAARAIPVPEGVASAVVRLADPRRYAVPAVLICPEFTPAQISELISQGELPELAQIRDLSLVDIDTGHWPMITAPAELARLIGQVAAGS